MKFVLSGAFGVAVIFAYGLAQAHVTLDTDRASPKSGFKAVLKITHGCKGSPTTAVRVKIPDGIIAAKPMPKPGWTLEIKKGAYQKPYGFYHGTLDEGTTSITWKGGSLPDDEYDEFTVNAFVSDAFALGDTVYFPVVQTCAEGEQRWVDIPKRGQDPDTLEFPAPTLTIVAPNGAAAP